jgi:hypothetical protein
LQRGSKINNTEQLNEKEERRDRNKHTLAARSNYMQDYDRCNSL